jgi:hypothetical protein
MVTTHMTRRRLHQQDLLLQSPNTNSHSCNQKLSKHTCTFIFHDLSHKTTLALTIDCPSPWLTLDSFNRTPSGNLPMRNNSTNQSKSVDNNLVTIEIVSHHVHCRVHNNGALHCCVVLRIGCPLLLRR